MANQNISFGIKRQTRSFCQADGGAGLQPTNNPEKTHKINLD